MQPADIAMARVRLLKLAATQQQTLERLRVDTAELSALADDLSGAAETDGLYRDAAGIPPRALGALLRPLHSAPDRATLSLVLSAGVGLLLPGSAGALSLALDGAGTELVAAWEGELSWHRPAIAGPDQTGLLRRIGAMPPEQALRLPLAHLGLELGELRVWPAAATDPACIENLDLLSICAGMALGALTLKHRFSQRGVRDSLTGLFNRRYMEATLARELHRARRVRAPLGLVLLDVDRLRELNVREGTTGGDRLLEAIGGLLQSTFRGSDVCCRVDGQRFVVVLPDAPLTDCMRRAEQILRLIAELRLARPGQADASACAGVAAFPDHAETADSLLLAAEAALYLAKRDGPGRARIAEKPV